MPASAWQGLLMPEYVIGKKQEGRRKMIKLVLLGNPLSTNNVYKIATKPFIRSYMSAAGKAAKNRYVEAVMEQYKKNPLICEVEIEVHLYFGDLRIRDFDNYQKLIIDSLNGIVLEDYRQIKKGTIVMKYDKQNPRAEIFIKKYVAKK